MPILRNIVIDQQFCRSEPKLPRDYLFEQETTYMRHWFERSINVKRRLINTACWDVRLVFPLYLILFFVHPDDAVAACLARDREKRMFELCLIADAIADAIAGNE